jgi:hypothetical protein
MTELLRFYPDGKYLYIEFLATKYIEEQPSNDIESKMMLERIRPLVAQLDAFVESRGLREIIELNLKDVPISKLNSQMACDMIDMCMSIRPDKNIVEKIVITNSNPVFGMIYKSVQGLVNPQVRKLLTIEANSKFD